MTQPVPLSRSPEDVHRRLIAQAVNNALQGKLNNTLVVTLAVSSTSTTVTDARIGITTTAAAHPTTAHAAADLASGSMYWTCANGSMTIHHASNAFTDRIFNFAFLGS
jgi:hypothetical protein